MKKVSICCDFYYRKISQGMITSLQNTTERLSSQIPAANVPQRMDAVQNALVKLEAQQINTTLTLSYAMELIQQITNGSLGRTK